MNLNQPSNLQVSINGIDENIIKLLRMVETIKATIGKLEEQKPFAEATRFNFYGDSVWVTVYTREELQRFLTLAPVWEKKSRQMAIAYTTTINNTSFEIHAQDAALPATCVEEEVCEEIPATEATTRKYKRIVCKV